MSLLKGWESLEEAPLLRSLLLSFVLNVNNSGFLVLHPVFARARICNLYLKQKESRNTV